MRTVARARIPRYNGSTVSLGQNIRRLRKAGGLRTQKALAESLGIPQPQVSDWENDRYAVLEVPTLIKLAKALRCSVNHLLAGIDPDYDAGLARPGLDDSPGGATPETGASLPVVPEGQALPDGISPDDRGTARDGVARWLARPAGLDDPHAYGVWIAGEAMLPAYRPDMIAVASPAAAVRDGDEVYVQLASGECVLRQAREAERGYLLQPYNPAAATVVVRPRQFTAMHAIVYARHRDA